MGAEGFLYITLVAGFFLEVKGIIVLRSVRLDLTRHDIADNKTVDSSMDVNNIALFISGFLSIPPWSCLCKIPLFLFIFIKKGTSKTQNCKTDYTNITFFIQVFEIGKKIGKYLHFLTFCVIGKSNNNRRFL